MLLGVLLVNFRDLWKSSPTSALLPRFYAHCAPPPIPACLHLFGVKGAGGDSRPRVPRHKTFHATPRATRVRVVRATETSPTDHLGRAPDAYRMCPRPLQSLSLPLCSVRSLGGPRAPPGPDPREDPKLGRISAMRGGESVLCLEDGQRNGVLLR